MTGSVAVRTSYAKVASMRRLLLLVLAIALLGAPATAPAQTGDIVERLREVPGLTIVEEREAPPPYRFFLLTYRQPADHARPSRGTFEQRFSLLHKGVDRPMVLHTGGYDLFPVPFRSEPTRLIDGNQISVEHRFFTPSRPEPADWSTLDIWQAATDHHRLVEALKPMYDRRWISTGGSKGGMATIYHRRFYPDDVDGTVAYVAPNDAIDFEDSRYRRFFQEVGTDPACRAALTALQREALGRRRTELVERYAAAAATAGWTFHRTVGTIDRGFEFMVLDTPWTFWQYGSPADCARVPAPTASTDEIYRFLDSVVGFGFYGDQGLELYIPYYFQAGTQFGFPDPGFRELRGVTRYRDLYRPRTLVPRELGMRFEPRRMLDVDLWVKHRGSELLFVYGENDPWSAEAFRLGRGTRDSYWFQVAGGNHLSTIGQLPPAEQAAAAAATRRWAGLDEAPSTPQIAALDAYDEAVDRRRR